MTDQWREFPRVWAQPLYVLVTGFDPRGAPVALPGALPIFSVGPSSRFYSPFWQTYYATVPAGTDPASVRSADRIVAAGYPLTPGPLRLASIGTRELGLSHPAGKPPVHPFTNDALVDHVAQQGFADAGLVFFVDFGASRFRVDDRNVVQETAMVHLALRSRPSPGPAPSARRGLRTSSTGSRNSALSGTRTRWCCRRWRRTPRRECSSPPAARRCASG